MDFITVNTPYKKISVYMPQLVFNNHLWKFVCLSKESLAQTLLRSRSIPIDTLAEAFDHNGVRKGLDYHKDPNCTKWSRYFTSCVTCFEFLACHSRCVLLTPSNPTSIYVCSRSVPIHAYPAHFAWDYIVSWVSCGTKSTSSQSMWNELESQTTRYWQFDHKQFWRIKVCGA